MVSSVVDSSVSIVIVIVVLGLGLALGFRSSGILFHQD